MWNASLSGLLSIPMPEPVRYQKKGISLVPEKGDQSGTRMLRNRTEMPEAGMPVQAASAWMTTPSYFDLIHKTLLEENDLFTEC
jgi:hypothetical protein